MGRRPCYYLTAVFYWLLPHNVLREWRRTWQSQPAPVWRPNSHSESYCSLLWFLCGCKESIHCGAIIISHLAQVVFHSYFLTQKEGQDEQKFLTLVIIGASVTCWRTFFMANGSCLACTPSLWHLILVLGFHGWLGKWPGTPSAFSFIFYSSMLWGSFETLRNPLETVWQRCIDLTPVLQ